MIFMPYQERDAEAVISWVSDETMYYQWSSGVIGDYPPTPDMLNAFYKEWKGKHHYMTFMLREDDFTPVGTMILRYPEEDPKHVRIGFILVDPAQRGKGYGRLMVEKAMAYAKDYLNVEDIQLGVYANNPGAKALYEKLGFVETGEVDREEHMGEPWECIEMVCTV